VSAYKFIRHLPSYDIAFPIGQPHTDQDWDMVLFGDGDRTMLLYAFRMEGTDAVYIDIPLGKWKQLLGVKSATIEIGVVGVQLSLPPNGSTLWQLDERHPDNP
jgi:hypothetical protein